MPLVCFAAALAGCTGKERAADTGTICAPQIVPASSFESANDTISSQTQTSLSTRIIALTNAQRQQAGLRPYHLACSELLQLVADAHSTSMARNNTFGHVDRNGAKPLDRVLAMNPFYRGLVAENVGLMTVDYELPRTTESYDDLIGLSVEKVAQNFVNNWMLSPSHRANILHPELTQIGVGVAVEANAVYVTQLFARPSR